MKTLAAEFELRVRNRDGGFELHAELELDDGVLVLFGPSGAGKSLTLQALTGLIKPQRGRVELAGETLFSSEERIFVPAHRRRIGYVPQHHGLFPFCNVEQNVAFGLPRRERRRNNAWIQELMKDLGIAHLARSRPGSLSGGERQRVALARALAVRPRLLVLDEPFASLDHLSRQTVRSVVRQTLQAYGTPAVLVTHDLDDVRDLGDRVVLFDRGRTRETRDVLPEKTPFLTGNWLGDRGQAIMRQ